MKTKCYIFKENGQVEAKLVVTRLWTYMTDLIRFIRLDTELGSILGDLRNGTNSI